MKRLVFLGFILLVFLSCKDVSKPVIISEDGAWCWFSDPRAVYFQGEKSQTYVTWVTSQGVIQIGAFNHRTNEHEIVSLDSSLKPDDHNNPAILISEEGKILLFYTGHASRMPIQLLVSKNPEDISEWKEPIVLDLNDKEGCPQYSQTYTYVNPVYVEREAAMYLYWRGVDFKPNVSRSLNEGKDWEVGKIFILPDRIYKDRRPYLKVSGGTQVDMHYAFTDGHPRNEESNSIYYCQYNDGVYQTANGEYISDWDNLPISPVKCDRVFDGGGEKGKAWIWDVAENKKGNPVIVFAAFPNDDKVNTAPYRDSVGNVLRSDMIENHIYYYACWNKGKWVVNEMVNSGKWFPMTEEGENEYESNYSAGLVLDHEDPSVVYLSRLVNGTFELEKWETKNLGQTWNVTSITSDSSFDNVRPTAVRGAEKGNPMQVVWMNNEHYISYRRFRSSIMGLQVK